MCGIAGFVGQGDAEDLRRMLQAQVHRGPDAEGQWSDPEHGLYLGTRRLAIVDLSGGDQPMWSADGTLGVVFNGEIYNHVELRAELEAKGHRFRSHHADTEVLLYAYREWGAAFVERLNGMWGFALLDRARRRLLLSRDRFGEKPLFWAQQRGLFAFASELRALLRHRQLRVSRSAASLQKYFAYGFVPSPRTIFDGARKLPPGCNLLLDLSDPRPRVERWWELALEPEPAPGYREDEAAAQLRELLLRAVERRLRCDVPAGVFLSGGIDSSTTAAFAKQALGGAPLATFSIGFPDPAFDESPEARRVARHLDTQHHEGRLELDDARALLPEVAARLDEPFADASLLPTSLLCREARRHVKVALGGDGADELFAGYDPFRALRFAEIYARLVPRALHPAIRLMAARWPTSHGYMSTGFRVQRTLRGLSQPPALWNPVWLGPCEPSEIEALCGAPAPREEVYSEAIEAWESTQGSSAERTLAFYSRLYLSENILVKLDRASMSYGLEARLPFLDIEVVDFVRRLPMEAKLRNGETKVLLRRAMQGILPEETLRRKKQGFTMPVGRWLAEGGLDVEACAASPGTDAGFRARRMQEHRAGRADHRLYLFAQLLLDRVDARYIEEGLLPAARPQPAPPARAVSRARQTVDTSSRFGFEWDRYREVFPHYESQFLGWIAPFRAEDLAGKDVLDAGCGMGRNALFAARYGARSVLAVDQASLAVNAAHELLAGVPGVRVERRSIYDLSIKRAFDVAMSIGVVHHLEHPRLALEKLVETLRRGGSLIVWLYGYEGNRGWANVFRRLHPLLRRVPPRGLHALAYALSLPLYAGLRLPVRKSPYLERAARFPFRHLHSIVFDQLLPEIAHYYRREEVEALFADLDVEKCEIFDNQGYSWTVICRK
jgi:asparagine synthase (glutamine-hydrolysing)